MKHFASPDFWRHYHALPAEAQRLADRCFALMKSDPRTPVKARLLLGLFLAIGLGSLLAMNRVYGTVLTALQTTAPALYTAALSTAVERTVGNGLGIVVGGLIFVAANKLQLRFLGTKQGAGC